MRTHAICNLPFALCHLPSFFAPQIPDFELLKHPQQRYIYVIRTATHILPIACGCALWLSPTLPAATITWNGPNGISGDSDVSTAGTTINAVNFGMAGFANTTTVNTITFTGASPSGGSLVSGDFSLASFVGNGRFNTTAAPYANLPTEYQSLLESGLNAGNGSFTLTISSLAVGADYQFQFWVDNSTPNTGSMSATAGNSVTVSANTTGVSGGLGQFAIGTFTADSNTETITFASGETTTYLSAAQLSQVSPAPEPATTALLSLTLAGVCAFHRRRTSK